MLGLTKQFAKTFDCVRLTNLNVFYKRKGLDQPRMMMFKPNPVYPAPGYDLVIPEWEVEYFLLRIGGGCSEHADKFENIKEIFDSNTLVLKNKSVPVQQRKHILHIVELMRRGVVTFEYLQRRTSLVKKA